jgi:hypothetical protein
MISRARVMVRADTILGRDSMRSQQDLRVQVRPGRSGIGRLLRHARRRTPRERSVGAANNDAPISVRVLFHCEYCYSLPDPETQRTLENQLQAPRFDEYLDALPGGWLIWNAGSALGSKRYACPEHRAALRDCVRTHNGSSYPGVWPAQPYPELWPEGSAAE